MGEIQRKRATVNAELEPSFADLETIPSTEVTLVPTTRPPRQPMTDIFTPSKDCIADDAYTTLSQSNTMFYYLDPGVEKESCYPSSYRLYQHMSGNPYSPGVCPHSYVYATTSLEVDDSNVITYAVCCPYNSSKWEHINETCMVTIPKSTTTIKGTHYGVWPSTYYANPISVAWRVSDISQFSPQSEARAALRSAGVTLPPEASIATSTMDSSTSSASFASSTSKTRDQDGGNSDSRGGGLSTGATAGIGVTVGITVIVSILAVWWLMKRYRDRQKSGHVGESGQLWEQQIYNVPDTTKASDQLIEIPTTGYQS